MITFELEVILWYRKDMNTSPSNNSEGNEPEVGPYLPSPVPSDQNLHEEELPFTAFGQHGEGNMDLRVFEQDKYWVNINGEPFLLDEMEQDYLFNVMSHLFTNVENFYVAIVRRAAIDLILNALSNSLSGEPPMVEQLHGIGSVTPVEWLNSTPLVKRIHVLLGW